MKVARFLMQGTKIFADAWAKVPLMVLEFFWGSLKITVREYCGVGGKTHQVRGVLSRY